MDRGSFEDDLPELSALLGLPCRPSSIPPSNLRRSPRKKEAIAVGSAIPFQDVPHTFTAIPSQTRRSLTRRSPKKDIKTMAEQKPRPETRLKDIPLLPRSANYELTSASSNNRSSPKSQHKPTHLAQVDSLLLPLSKLAMEGDTAKSRSTLRLGSTRMASSSQKSMMSMMTEVTRQPRVQKSPRKTKLAAAYTSRYVFKEARCNDDEESGRDDEDDDDETDLSGFIVDDNADLSYQEWSGSDFEEQRPKSRRTDQRSPRRRLHEGSRRRSNSNSEYHNLVNEDDGVSSALQHLTIAATQSKHTASHERMVIDLTSSPVKPRDDVFAPTSGLNNPFETETTRLASGNLFDDFDQILRLSPPKIKTAMNPPEKPSRQASDDSGLNDDRESQLVTRKPSEESQDQYKTPPTTPPRSPSKLKSPSKLLSPSMRDHIARSSHRQSTDAFWDLNTVNEWHDINSPKKAPTASPRKKGLARFQLWSDDSNDETSRISDNSLPSPCDSPTKLRSPLKSPEKVEKKRIAEEKKIEKARKTTFDLTKKEMAQELLNELDAKIAEGKIGVLAASTGGVNINWSNTLRSTAGRANWRRTVTKSSGSPIKGKVSEGPGIKVEHFANIELAEKVIDCEERLVNTLAHEFCHLANFMVSNIRDQPHGASFKSWAAKVTKHLRKSENELWRKVEVTTKHNYAINHKYLWVCVGRDKTKVMEFLNMDEVEGCGAEYGRHSKSIDPEKSRCGRCKGKLVQVRPKPRMSPVKKIEKMIAVVELSD